ncbi:hypothetical protein DSM100238_0362 [Bifidobacterium apri]|uniref:Uncharacterized protein n=2 Tax=Bifidobacterium TaxID=1678 RepID=A0A6A2VI92_9BIFI|nr:hypothetical protein DSM100238_0362 [Bifidobacterium apri]
MSIGETCNNEEMSDMESYYNLGASVPASSVPGSSEWGGQWNDEELAAAIKLDERIAQLNMGSGGVYGRVLHENLRYAKGIVVDSNALRCEIPHGVDSSTDDWEWLHYFLVAFTDVRGRQVRVWSGDVTYSARDLALGSSVVVEYADRDSADDVRIRRIFTYRDFNVSMPGTVPGVPGGSRLHHVSGADDYQDPRSFGSLWRHAEWRERYATSGMDGYRAFGASSQPQDANDGKVARESTHNARALRAIMGVSALAFMLTLGGARFQPIPQTQELIPWMKLTIPSSWPFVAFFLMVFLASSIMYVLRYGHAQNTMRGVGKPRLHQDEFAQVLDIVIVPLFSKDAYCGCGYLAKLRTQSGDIVWAMGDPEERESYLPQGSRPPIVVGGNATLVRTLGKRTYVHSATTQSTVLP